MTAPKLLFLSLPKTLGGAYGASQQIVAQFNFSAVISSNVHPQQTPKELADALRAFADTIERTFIKS